MIRLELIEKYIDNEEEIDYLLDMGITPKKNSIVYNYRRTSVSFEDIERIIEIPGNKQECIVRFYNMQEMTIKENFDTFCIYFNDLFNAYYEDED